MLKPNRKEPIHSQNRLVAQWHVPASLVMGWQLLIGGLPVVCGAALLEPLAAVTAISVKAFLMLALVVLGLMVVSLGLTGLSRRPAK